MSSPAAIQFSNAHRSVKTRTAPGISRGELTRDAILTLTTSTLHPQTQSTSHYVLPISDKPAYERDPDHRSYVKSLYRRYLNNSLNWVVRRDIWRQRAIEIRAEFERNRNITDPRALAIVLEQAEENLARNLHPDPYRPPTAPEGTKWERNLPPPIFSEAEKEAALKELRKTVSPFL